MRILLDTHALLWWLIADPRLGPAARDLIADPANDVLVSVASLWEIQVKVRVGKLTADLDGILTEVRNQGLRSSGSPRRTCWPSAPCHATIAIPGIICSSPRRRPRVPPSCPRIGTSRPTPSHS